MSQEKCSKKLAVSVAVQTCADYFIQEKENNTLAEQNKNLIERIIELEQMAIDYNELQDVNQVLVDKVEGVIDTMEKNFNIIQSIEKVLTPGQIHMLANPDQKQARWTSEDIAEALTLHCLGPRVYRYLRQKGLPLPGELHKIDLSADNSNTGTLFYITFHITCYFIF